MNREYEEAFAEIDEIFKIMPIDLLSKIPVKIREIISDNKAKDYNVKIQEPLDEKSLKAETIAILGLLYRDYISSPEERERLQLEDQKELERIEGELNKKYDINKVLDSRKNKVNTDVVNEEFSKELTVYKEPGFIKRILNFIKGFFK